MGCVQFFALAILIGVSYFAPLVISDFAGDLGRIQQNRMTQIEAYLR